MGRLGRRPWDHPHSPQQGPTGAPGQAGLRGRHRGSREGRPEQHLWETRCPKEKILGSKLTRVLPLNLPGSVNMAQPQASTL